MCFKLAVILASLAYVSAGYLEPLSAYTAAPLAYNSYANSALSYGYGHLNSARPLALPYNNYGYPSYADQWATKAVAVGQPILKYAPALPYAHKYTPALNYNNIGYSSYVAPLAAKSLAIAEPAPIAYEAPLVGAHPALGYAPALPYSNLGHASYAAPLVAKTHGYPLLTSHLAPAYGPALISGYADSYAHHKSPLVKHAY